MDLICRICLQEKYTFSSPNFMSIFTTDDRHTKLSNKIMECTAVQISENDCLPHYICDACVSNLDIAYKFKTLCEDSDQTLKLCLETKKGMEMTIKNINDSVSWNELLNKNCDMRSPVKRELEVISPLLKTNGESISPLKPKRGRPKKEKKNLQIKHDQVLTVAIQPLEISTEIVTRKRRASKKKDASDLYREIEANIKLEEVQYEEDSEYLDFEEDFTLADVRKKPIKVRGRPKKIYLDEDGNILPRKPKQLLVCDQCGRSFKFLHSLQVHQRRHNGEKPFMCSTCGRAFFALNELKKHQLIHTGAKPYKCSYCERKFADWGSRFKHETCHRGERPYHCDQCPKSFTYSYVLSRHKLVHTGVKQFSCNLCKKNFTLKYHLTNHNRKHHSDLLKNLNKAHEEISPDAPADDPPVAQDAENKRVDVNLMQEYFESFENEFKPRLIESEAAQAEASRNKPKILSRYKNSHIKLYVDDNNS